MQRLHYQLDKEVSHLEIKIVAFTHEKRRHSRIAVLITRNETRVQSKLQSSCTIQALQMFLRLLWSALCVVEFVQSFFAYLIK